jgi:hypothetical protein
VTAWILVWFVIALVTTIALLAFFAALVRHGILLGRAVARFGEEAGALATDIGRESSRASDRAANLSLGGRTAGQG